jgi:sugar phosphate isomerase/epimerase
MNHYLANIDDFGMDSLSLAGPLEAKLGAVRAAGFSQIMLSAQDLVNHPDGMDAAVAAVLASGLRVTGFQMLRDFEGLAGPLHDYKIEIAKTMLSMCQSLGCHLLLTCSSSLKSATDDTQTLVNDLRQLAMLAIPMHIKIAYQAGLDGHSVRDFPQAWDLVCRADRPNLGLALDTFEMLALGSKQDDLDLLESDKLFLVRLADAMAAAEQCLRVFPGEGVHRETIATWVSQLHAMGYRGAYSFAVFNQDCQQMPPASVSQRARRAALWLGEDVLQRSVPLPNQIRLKRAAGR